MTEVRFYHLTRQTIEAALPDLLEKTLVRDWRAVVKMPQEADVERMNDHLWSYRPESFLPHGSAKDGGAEGQPIWLTTTEENPNGATVLFVINGAKVPQTEGFDLVCDLFDGNDAALTQAARERWSVYKDKGLALTYWQQGEKGWQQKGQE